MVRDAHASEVRVLAGLWHDTWHEAHAALVPAAAVAPRTRASFETRLRDGSKPVRVTGPVGSPSGLCVIVGNELSQLFVDARARGTGTALALERDACRRFRRAGVRTAWLACARGNDRAAAFYEKRGWRRTGTMSFDLQAHAAPCLIEVWRYERRIPGAEVATRTLGPGNGALYRALRLRALEESPDAFGDTFEQAAARPEAFWHECLRDGRPGTDYPVLATIDGEPAGLAWGRRDSSDEAIVRVYQMWVAPEWRGRGAGARLLDAVLDWAENLGARRVELSVTCGNVAAEALYRQVGFVACGVPVALRTDSALRGQALRLELDASSFAS